MAGCFPYQDPDCCKCSYNNKLYEISKNLCGCSEPKTSLNASDIYYCLKDAVVRIRTVTGVLLEGSQVNRITEGNGFLVKYGSKCRHCTYIVTASQLLLFQPGFGTRIPPPVNLPNSDFFSRVGDIYVEVTNVNGDGVGYIYKATLVGMDGANDVGVLRIDYQEEYNRRNPEINPKKHPHLEWGNSRRTPIGTPLYFISGEGEQQIQQGIVTNNRFFQFDGQPQFEAIQVRDIAVTQADVGGPFLDCRGRIIGVGVAIPLYDFSGAVAEHVAHRIVDAIVGGLDGCYAAQLEVFPDPLGPFLRYRKGFFGFLWESFNAFATLNIEASPPPPPPPLSPLKWQKLQGLIILDILQGENGIVSPFLESFLNVPENTNILITHINGCPAGVRAPQITFNTISVHSLPGEPACLSYRLSTDGYTSKFRTQASLAEWPLLYDNVFNISVSLSARKDSSIPQNLVLRPPRKKAQEQRRVAQSEPSSDSKKNPEEEKTSETSELDILGEIRNQE